jgi:light-regulated signal transduction histidine kinase (bacteriophytochrome)
MSESSAAKKNITITTEYAHNLPSLLELDKYRITQVVMNLIGNAIKFTEQKGKVFVRVFWTPNSITSKRRDSIRKYEPTKSQSYSKYEEKQKIVRKCANQIDKGRAKRRSRHSAKRVKPKHPAKQSNNIQDSA